MKAKLDSIRCVADRGGVRTYEGAPPEQPGKAAMLEHLIRVTPGWAAENSQRARDLRARGGSTARETNHVAVVRDDGAVYYSIHDAARAAGCSWWCMKRHLRSGKPVAGHGYARQPRPGERASVAANASKWHSTRAGVGRKTDVGGWEPRGGPQYAHARNGGNRP